MTALPRVLGPDRPWPEEETFDVVVVGATPAGCAAALAAARSGCRVLLLEPTSAVGGMHANGVHAFDTASLEAISGIGAEFAERIRAHYEASGMAHDLRLHSASDLYWESQVAQATWLAMLEAEPLVLTVLGAVPVGVEAEAGLIEAVLVERAVDAAGRLPPTPRRVLPARGRVVVDATYEGDIAAWAGAAFRLGREARSRQEPHAGVIYTTYLDREPVDEHLPQSILPGSTGAADDRVMAFNCRLTCRLHAGHGGAPRQAAPPGYNPADYAWDRDYFLPGGQPRFGTGVIPSVNGKMLLNCAYKGNDLVGPNREYILAAPRERAIHRQCFIDRALGFLHFIQTEGNTPELGLAEDEYCDNGGIPVQIYVREGRRVEGLCRMTEEDINPHLRGDGFRPPLQPDAIAIGDWAIESKKCRDAIEAGRRWSEGLVHARGVRAPYQVPYGAIVPRGQRNLFVACAVSATHIAYCAVRVESVWVQLGMAAGCAAALALSEGVSPDRIEVDRLQRELLLRGAKLVYLRDVEADHAHFRAVQWAALRGFLPRDAAWRFFPDLPITWSGLVELAVKALDLPISVTGAHFEGLQPGDAAFRFAETLYDQGSRSGVAVFEGMLSRRSDPSADHHRAETRTRWLLFRSDEAVCVGEAERLLLAVLRALGLTRSVSFPHVAAIGQGLLSRSAACALVHEASVLLGQHIDPGCMGDAP